MAKIEMSQETKKDVMETIEWFKKKGLRPDMEVIIWQMVRSIYEEGFADGARLVDKILSNEISREDVRKMLEEAKN